MQRKRQWPPRADRHVTIYDRVPAKHTLYPEGTRVYFIWRDGQIQKGKVTFYNPAMENSCVTTKGHRFYSIDYLGAHHMAGPDRFGSLQATPL